MKILIITTYFPPDTAIAAVRPYMFAKHLTKLGHNVTVVRSGELISKPDDSWPIEGVGFSTYSYMGEDSPAERYRRGEALEIGNHKSRIAFLPASLYILTVKLYRMVFSRKLFRTRLATANEKYEKQKKCLRRLKENGASFDVVFSTYGALENVYAGEYAAKLFNCKYIVDFRDLMASRTFHNKREYSILNRIQRKAVLAADICTCVSDCAANVLRELVPEKRIITLYNGYESTDSTTDETESKYCFEGLSFCYSGQLYTGLSDASPLFRAISANQKTGKIDATKVRFFYAGNGFEIVKKQASQYGLGDIVFDCGYLGRQEVQALQSSCDIFTVLSWNTHREHGVLTGKFYEGIRCKKPILTVLSGNEANSELKMMNDKYHYGFCYEQANDAEDFERLKEWIYNAYQTKMRGENIPCQATSEFATDFRYDHLTAQLETIMKNLL